MNWTNLAQRLERTRADRANRRQVARVEDYLAADRGGRQPAGAPVLFFNASTRIHTLSLNAAFSLLASWGLRSAGVPVRYVVCHAGMTQCILGTRSQGEQRPPPCGPCRRFSALLFPEELVIPIPPTGNGRQGIADTSLEALLQYRYRDLPLGELCLPGLRWALRRHHLDDDPLTRQLLAQYLDSAAHLVEQFGAILERVRPRALVVFNGVMYPEAVARELARRLAVPVITHEVGLRPFSAFFSHELATFRQVDLPDPRDFGPGWEGRLELDLGERRRGRFSMAGVEFWPEMEPLPPDLVGRLSEFDQIVAIFTNIVFDTSQLHANVAFADMFDWLDALAGVIESHPRTLFILRAHPDEERPGKVSRQSVADWFSRSSLADRPNVHFIPPSRRISSYDLIERAKLVLVYSSSIGLEASILGVPVLCAGKARYTQADTVYHPADRGAYFAQLESFLTAGPVILPARMRHNAKRFLYAEQYLASLDFSAFLRPYPSLPGMVLFSDFPPAQLLSEPGLQAIRQGVLEGAPFRLDEVRQEPASELGSRDG